MKLPLPKTGFVLVIAWLFPILLQAQDDTIQFSDAHPLVFEDSWDLWPYSFLDEQGEPQGFNVELAQMIMKDLNLPYIIKLKARREVLNDLKEGRAHLTLGMDALFHKPYGHFGKQVVQLFTHSLLSPKGRPVLIKTEEDLAKNKVIVHQNSFSHNLMKQKGWERNAIPYDDMKEAVQDISTTMNGQILWNTASLKWLLRMYQIENLQLTPIDMPHGEYKFMGNDSLLLEQIDNSLIRIRSNGLLEPLQNKWFYPERQDTGIPSWIWYLAGIIGLAVFVLLYYNISYRTQEQHIHHLGQRRNNRLALVLQASHVSMWTYDVATQLFTIIDTSGLSQRKNTLLEFARHYHADDFERVIEGLRKLTEMEETQLEIELKAQDENTGEEHEYMIALSILRFENKKPSIILGTKSDITDDRKKQRQAKLQLQRYQSVLNTAMVDMVYFDQNGYVAYMNERAQLSFDAFLEDVINRKVNLQDCLSELDFNPNDYFYATQLKNGKHGMEYYELQLVPVHDHQNNLLGIYGTGRDVSEMVLTFRKNQESIKNVQKATQEITAYVRNINYVLEVGGVRMTTYSPESHTLTIYKGLNVIQLSLTQSRCMAFVDEQSKKTALRALNNMDAGTVNTIDAEIKTTIRRSGMPLYLHMRFVPTYNEQGQVENYFGLCRDISEIKTTELLLEKESARAQKEEDLKNSFLHNMNYEIRTPLNNVVGFAELFEKSHSPEDEDIFIREIKNSSAYLLDLINDILFLSRLDAHMIEINKQPVDFAKTFEDHCKIGWESYRKNRVHYIVENHYEQLVVDIDDVNLGRIIEQVVTNAAQNTDNGTVRARYDYIGDKLMIAIEDTGCGISEESLTQIYERFASITHHGTGLGLPICKLLTEQMGGSIDVNSEEGKGTTVWITIPCTATAIDRKKEIWKES